jgi:methionine-rich copper-binding protein CopC
MRKFFTRLLMMVFLVSVMFHVYAAGPPVADPLPAGVTLLWPEDGSTTQALPGTDNVFVLKFTKDLHETAYFGAQGVIALSGYASQGIWQVDPILLGNDGGGGKVEKKGPREVHISFNSSLLEDSTYHITIEDDAIRFADGTWFGGVVPMQWNFTVKDVTPPQMVTCDDDNNVNGLFNVSLTQDPIAVCFSEPVWWAPGADPMKIGNIAFYTAAKAGLDPNDEFGGDVIYEKPKHVILYNNDMVVYNSLELKAASIVEAIEFDKVEIWLKGEPDNGYDLQLKHAAIGNNVWPVDRDIYLRFAAGLLVDKGGNEFAGINGSPFDPYNVSSTKYWFSTRLTDEIPTSARAVAHTSTLPGTNRSGALWSNDDIVVEISNGSLEIIPNTAITNLTVKQFIKLSIDGSDRDYSVKLISVAGGTTSILIEPGTLPEKKQLKVDLLGDKIQDKGDLRVVEANSWTFNTGDYTPPMITASVNNILCTNFDLRVNTDENGVVFYAVVKEPVPTHWDAAAVTPLDVVRGYRDVVVGSTTHRYYFYHVDDAGATYGPAGTGGTPSPLWVNDNFNITPSLTAFEKVLNFTEENHGDKYRIYYFAHDPNAQGPYNNPAGTPDGRVTAVSNLPVQLTDCLEPEIAWFFEGVNTTNDPLFDACEDEEYIKKQGRWKLDFTANPEGLYLEFDGETWDDVIILEVSTDGENYDVVERTITPIEVDGKVVGLTVTPLNSYPSGGHVMITLLSGSVRDAAGNTINEDLICEANVQNYDDPWVKKFTVETKSLMFPDEFPMLDGVAAKKNGKITIEFNNPMYTPKRDETGALPILVPISEDPAAENYIGKYVKLRVGALEAKLPSPDATVTSDIVSDDPFTFVVTRDSKGGITKIVATPKVNYASETWYFVDLEQLLQDENRVDLTTIDNNNFTDPHDMYSPNAANYFIQFRSEDTIAPTLRFVFEKYDNSVTPATVEWPYIADVDEDEINCISFDGFEENGAPIGAIITEWSEMGFDNKDYYINTDPNGLRPYFKLKDSQGNELPFDVVVLRVYEPDAPGSDPYMRDAVWFGFVPFVELEEGDIYTMEFMPTYQAPGSALAEGPVFVDDNGNELIEDTYVSFMTCSPNMLPVCLDPMLAIPTTVVAGKNTTSTLTPSFTITFPENTVNALLPYNSNPSGHPTSSPVHMNYVLYFQLTGGSKTWKAYTNDFTFINNTIQVPFSSFVSVPGAGYTSPGAQLDEKTEYTLTVTAGVFYDRQFNTLVNCTKSIKFWTPDLTAPMVSYLSPDKIVDTNNNLGQSPYAIDPRNPGRLIIGWNETVTPQAGKLVEVWQNGTTKRLTFTMEQGTFVSASNRWWVQLPADFLQYNSNFHVDVQEGFVKDPTGNMSARLTGYVDGTDTWTFSTGEDSNPEIIAWTPICMVEPGNMHTQPHGADSVKINKITITLSEKATPVAGKNLYVEFARGGATLRSWNVSSMTSTDQLTWTITPNPAFIVANNDDYIIYVQEGAFAQTYSANSLMSGTTPDYEGDNFLSCEIDGFDTVIPASFAFSDTSAPTARIWPENGNVKIPFNAHGYVRFTESLIAFNSMDQMLVVTQNNIKNWIKVWKYDAAGANPTPLASDEYVVEFVNPERTHARITFHDPEAPAIDGYTYNLQDEWDYAIVVNAEGDNGYWLQDMVGNILFDDDATVTNDQKISKFRTEDITPPNFYVTTCDLEPEMVEITIKPWVNVDPYDNGRDYPAEAGKAYYVVRPAGTTVTAANLYNKTWADVKEVNVPAGGVTVNWTLPAEIRDNYNYTVYVVMQDAESDLYVAPAYNNAWVTTDPVFIASGDANLPGAIGIADIRPAPNKNMAVKTWNFCFCDDDQPLVVSKEWNQHMNVPVDETFEIKFNEFIQPGADVRLSGEGTGGTIMTPDYGYEVRLREWDNNVAVPIRIKGNGTGTLGLNGATGIIITPGSDLDEETKYYIEIDRWVVWDVAGSNCDSYENVQLPDNFPVAQCTLCSDEDFQNNFPGWIGRNEWWFKTTDNTAPILTAVSPLGDCVPVNNNKIVFTFKEKNEMVIKQLAGINTNSIYIYKQGSTIPYEVIPAASGAIVRTGTDTWTITYTTLHPYNSEEIYSVEWNKGIFVDNAIPVQHNYTESLSAVVDGQTSAWHKFSFTSEDNLKPVANWAFMNRLWVEEYDDENLAYPLAIGSYDSNDILAQPVDVCEMYQVPQFVGAYVWFNEPTALTAVTIASGESESSWKSRWMNENFYLTTPTGTISLKWISNGNTGGSPVTLPNGAGVVPANTDWYYIEFNGALASLGEFDFGIKAGKIKDVNATNCRVNTLDAIKLFNFCVWDATAPTAQLFDGQEVEILNVSANNYLETCVEEGTYFRLKFNKPVVKTSAIMMPPQFGNPVNPFWWTYDNLYLTVADLMDNGGPIYSFENADTDELVEIMAVEIVVPGQEYKIFPKYPLVSEDHYEFVINEDVLKDMVRIPNGNFFPGKTWEFIVTDWEAPYITSVFPADEAVNISPVSNLTITFNEEVSLGTSARIIIRDNGTNGLIYNFRADDSQHVTLSANKKTVTINHDGLNKNDMYYVQIEPGFVKDASCKFLPFEGKFEQGLVDDTWNFKTGDIDGPVAMLWPTPGDDCVEIDANLVIRFDENITLTDAGKLVIYKVIEGGSFHNPMWPDAMFGDVVAVIPFTNANFPQIKISGSDAPNGLTANIVTVTPPLGLWESKATYYVRIVGDGVINDTEADVVVDAVGNSWAYPVSHSFLTELPGIHHNQWYFTIGNNDEPVLVSMTPEWGETVPAGVASASTDLTMTFEEEVAFGSGAIKVYEFIVAPEGGVAEQQANLWMEFNIPADVASGKVSLSADMKTVTVHDVALLDGITWYYVLVEPGAITNNIECTLRHWEGISNPDTWLFHTAPDITDPVLVDNAVTSDACSEMYLNPSTVAIELHFSEPVSVANGTGLVEIMEDGEVVASATITAAHIDGNIVTLSIEDFDNAIEDQKMYTIVIGGNAIHDRATASLTGTQNPVGLVPFGNENWYAGTEIEFHTGDFTAPVAINFEPNMVIDLENDVTLKVWFSEPVQSGTGKLILTDADSGQEWEFMAEDAIWSADMMMLSYEVELPDETSYFVTLEEGFVMDMVYMDSCDEPRHSEAVTDEEAWTFAIDDNTVPSIVEDLTEDVNNLMMSFHVVLEYDDIITYVDASKAILWFDGYPTTGGVTGAEIGTDPTTVIIHVTAPQDQTEYMLQLVEGFVWDDAINPNASLDTITGPYYVGDRTAPILEAAGPTGILPTYIGVEVFVDFFDDSELTVVAPITIEDAEGDVVATWTPVLDAEQADSYMLDLMNALPYPRFGEYTVTIPAGAVVDVNGNEFAGFTWTFAIIDNTPPDMNCLTIVNPEDGDTGVLADVDLIMEFCERMAAGDQDMLVKVYEILEVQGQLGENTLFYSTPVTTAMVNLTTVTIPLTGLKDNTSYIVLIDDGALTDEAGNAFGGIYDPTVWNFTTGDNTPPTVVLDPASSTNDKNEIVVIATFSEEVVGAIDAIIVEGAQDYEITTIDDVVFTITITAADDAEVTITVPVTITDVADAKGYGNPLAEEVSGTYVVGDNTAPTVTITTQPAVADSTANEFTVVLTFSEKVDGVEAGLAGSVGIVDWDVDETGTVYTLYFEGLDNTELKLHLDATKVTDVSENANELVAGLRCNLQSRL